MLKDLILGLMLTGLVVGLCGALASFSWRKDGVSSRELWLAGSKAAAYPERYVRPDRVLVVRVLNLVGVGLCLAGVLIMVAGTVQPLLR
ncbi:hypothetical protein [Anaeromyxobacter oryzae]|uniref:Uncharacterized protein n=1 Tax=Anaeromyxobacter oryzae TaxID=2918170 RepID=A0ABM7WYM5_9BACT|nr:hypothetical protein [Anaeromyxobacter oryzae]BDG04636.1 hypothetical protein AMOR_36320 [Anaeromyxobacter oryzae]